MMLLFSFCSYGNHYVYPLLDWTVPSRGILTFAGVFLLYCIYCLLLYLVHKLKRFLHRLFSTVWSPQCVGLIQNNLRLSFVHLSQYLLSSMQLKVSFPVIYMQHIKIVIFCLGKRNHIFVGNTRAAIDLFRLRTPAGFQNFMHPSLTVFFHTSHY